MKLSKRGKSILGVEVVNISPHGFWLDIQGKEYFLPFEDYPWFKKATVSQISNVQHSSPIHLYWSDLDVDLEVDSLGHPESYPLIYR